MCRQLKFQNCDFTFQVTLMLLEVRASSCISRGGPSGAAGKTHFKETFSQNVNYNSA